MIWALAATLALGACDAPTRRSTTPSITGVTSTVTISPDGSAEIRETITVRPGSETELPLSPSALPGDVRVEDFTLDGDPLSDAVRARGVTLPSGAHTVTYRIRGTTRSVGNTATATVPLWQPSGSLPLEAHLIPMKAEISLPPGAAVNASESQWTTGVWKPDVVRRGSTILLSGAVHPTNPAGLTVEFPSGLVPGVTASPEIPGSRRAERVRASLQRADTAFWQRVDSARERADLLATGYWLLVAVEIAAPVLVSLVGLLRALRSRRFAAREAARTATEAPQDIAPDVLAVLTIDSTEVDRAAIAAVTLELVRREAIEMQHVSSTDFRLRPASGADALRNQAEVAVLRAVHDRLGPDGWVAGPPLGLAADGELGKPFRRDVMRRAMRAGLLKRRFPSGIYGFAVVMLLLTTAPLWLRSAEMAFGATVVAATLLALSALGGFRLTPSGHRAKARGDAYARYLEAQTEMNRVGVPGVVMWGPNLVYAAATGVATSAIDDLTAPHVPGKRSTAQTTTSPPSTSTPTRARGSLMSLVALVGVAAIVTAGVALSPRSASAAGLPPVDCEVGSRTDLRQQIALSDARTVLRSRPSLICQDLHDLDLIQVDLSGMDLRRINLTGARLGQADLVGAHLEEANLAGADLTQADLTQADLTGADLTGADMGQATLVNSVLDRVRARGLDLTQATMTGSSMRGADLSAASFGQVGLTQADLSEAVLDKADFTQAHIDESDFTSASLRDADLDVVSARASVFGSADLTGAKSIGTLRSAGADVTGAVGLPAGLVDSARLVKPLMLAAAAIVVLGLLASIVKRSRRLTRS